MDAASLLASKKLRTATVTVDTGDGGGAVFHLQALPARQYRELLDDHPARKEDGDNADWNRDTFPPALIAACVTDPVFTVEQATELWDRWEAAETGNLFLACWQLNERTASTAFMLPGYAPTSGSGPNSDTA